MIEGLGFRVSGGVSQHFISSDHKCMPTSFTFKQVSGCATDVTPIKRLSAHLKTDVAARPTGPAPAAPSPPPAPNCRLVGRLPHLSAHVKSLEGPSHAAICSLIVHVAICSLPNIARRKQQGL